MRVRKEILDQKIELARSMIIQNKSNDEIIIVLKQQFGHGMGANTLNDLRKERRYTQNEKNEIKDNEAFVDSYTLLEQQKETNVKTMRFLEKYGEYNTRYLSIEIAVPDIPITDDEAIMRHFFQMRNLLNRTNNLISEYEDIKKSLNKINKIPTNERTDEIIAKHKALVIRFRELRDLIDGTSVKMLDK